MKKLKCKDMAGLVTIVASGILLGLSLSAMAADDYEGCVVYNGHSYKVFQGGVDWNTAEEMCERIGGHLVKIPDANVQAFVEDLLYDTSQDHCWIGLKDDESEGWFTWTDETAALYTNWGSGQPDNYEDREDHVLITCRDMNYGEWGLSRGEWNDTYALGDVDHDLSKIAYICEWDRDVTQDTIEEISESVQSSEQKSFNAVTYDGHQYAVIDEGMTWQEAEALCERAGGHLVCINSEREQQYVQSTVVKGGKDYYWIGLTDEDSEGEFRWINGDPLTYVNWGKDQPDDWQDSEDWTMMPNRDRTYAEWENAFGTWNDMNSAGDRDHSIEEMGIICEWDYMDEESRKALGNVIEDIESILEDEGIAAVADACNGTITLDSAILFDVDSYQIGQDGIEALNIIMSVMRTVMADKQNQQFISSINIQGHTDSTGSYSHNVDLSINRAESVYSVCREALGNDAEAAEMFNRLFEVSGCACDYPVLDANGNEDKDASRRVVFVFGVGR